MAKTFQILLLLIAVTIATSLPVRFRRHLFAKEGLSSSSTNGDGPPQWARKKPVKTLISKPTGHSVEFRCQSEGRPTPEIQWYKGDKLFTSRQLGTISQKRWLLRLDDVIVNDSGNYTCVVSNEYGSIKWTYELEVVAVPPKNPPLLYKKPENQTVTQGENSTLACQASSNLEPMIFWYKHVIMQKENETSEHVFELQRSGVNISQPHLYHIINATYEDAGKYSCFVYNNYGRKMADAWVTVVPPEPERVSIVHVPIHKTSLQTLVPVSLAMGIILTVVLIILCYCRGRCKKPLSPPRIMMQENIFYSGDKLNIPFDAKWEFPKERLELGDILGEGAFGKVVKAMATGGICSYQTNVTVAVKMLKEDATEYEVRNLLEEMQVMKTIGAHKNIVNLLGTCTQDGPRYLYLVVEYAAHGNLRDFLRTHRGQEYGYELPHQHMKTLPTPPSHLDMKPLTQKDLLSFCYQIARGMEYLTSKKIVHRDLAARNILVYDDLVLKIADFGLTRKVADQDYYRKMTNGRVPVKWMAPEALHDHKYSAKSDVWSYGVLLWEVYTLGGSPLATVPMEKLLDLLRAGYRMEKPPYASYEIHTVMLGCWRLNPKDRLPFAELVVQFDKFLSDCKDTGNYLLLDVIQDSMEDTIPSGLRTPRRSDSQYSSGGSTPPSEMSLHVDESVNESVLSEPSPLLEKEETDCEHESSDDENEQQPMNLRRGRSETRV
uniref:receptor protein-tyrosine kinase n=1 Tax=Alitta virens TaxID=880429 RepID=A0A8F2EG64_ALIVI|nr:fibroblast growth factor receptor 2 [Alitta virens]